MPQGAPWAGTLSIVPFPEPPVVEGSNFALVVTFATLATLALFFGFRAVLRDSR